MLLPALGVYCVSVSAAASVSSAHVPFTPCLPLVFEFFLRLGLVCDFLVLSAVRCCLECFVIAFCVYSVDI